MESTKHFYGKNKKWNNFFYLFQDTLKKERREKKGVGKQRRRRIFRAEERVNWK